MDLKFLQSVVISLSLPGVPGLLPHIPELLQAVYGRQTLQKGLAFTLPV